MKKKLAVVTGGTSGVGLSLVDALVANNYKVFFIGTNVQKGNNIEDSYPSDSAEFVLLDLCNLKAIQQFAEVLQKKHSQLDLLANIAGVLLPERQLTVDGIEKTFAISYLGSFYLTNSLIPLLKNADQARIVNVAGGSSMILRQKLNFEDLNLTENYSDMKASSLAVHAKTVFTQSLSERLAGTSITVNAFNPGVVKSDLFRNLKGFKKLAFGIASLFFAKQSKTGIYICLSDEVSSITGKLFDGRKVIPLDFNAAYREKLWDESEKMIREIL